MTEVSTRAVFVMPRSVSDRLLASASGPWGTLHVKWDLTQELGLIVGGTFAGESGFEAHTEFLDGHQSRYADVLTDLGVWYRAEQVVDDLWGDLSGRDAALATDAFRRYIPQGWKAPPADSVQLILTGVAVDDSPGYWRAWRADAKQVVPVELHVVDETADVFAPLVGLWPVDALRAAHVVVVGLGSLGAPLALALAAYGVGHLTLVDPDRLKQHNLVRHVLDQSVLGHFKVSSVRAQILRRFPETDIAALALDFIDSADSVREVVRGADTVVCATDGVAPRQAVNHIARWAQTNAVFAAVFDDGGLGEVIQIRSDRASACLSCHRTRLYREHLMEPERSLDLGYGTGFIHRPMTAVGPDIALLGDIAAKVTVATILEAAGNTEQALPGDQLVVGLRPQIGLDDPFDVQQPLAFKWSRLTVPETGCPDCDPK